MLPVTASIALEVEVLESVDRKAAAESKKAAGMLLGLVGDKEAAIQDIDGLGPASAPSGLREPMPRLPDTGPSSSPTGAAGASPIARLPRHRLPPQPPKRLCRGRRMTPISPPNCPWTGFDRRRPGGAARQTEGPDLVVPTSREKKDLSPAERERIKPAGDFVMDLTKAMLADRAIIAPRTHPGSQNAKARPLRRLPEMLSGIRRKS